MNSKNLKVVIWVGFLILCLSATAWSQNLLMAKKSQKKAASEGTESVSLPEDLDATQVDQIVAGLSDEQVRRLLLNELKLQARKETTDEAKPEGLG